MTISLPRRTVLATGAAALITSTVPARASGEAPTPTMRGGSNN